jgi:tRNA 5-methylaminomethyl-2-thiouridine biosynthesis bifunctional protein
VLRRIEPARVVLDATGAPFNEDYGDVYVSRDGAAAQARHVFLAGNDLPSRWRGRHIFVIVETGFGLGVNFLATWQAWREDPARAPRLHFVSVERHPVDAATLVRLAPPELASLAQAVAAALPLPLPGLHRLAFDAGAVELSLLYGDAESGLAQIVAGADAFYLDGFAPDRNPDVWTARVMKVLARLARDGATVATWCTARSVRDALSEAGFEVAPAPGFGHKRHMLRGRFAPRWRVRRHEPPARFEGERDAIVIGAGLAGAHAAHALARRGWRVQVLERGARVAPGASALPWGMLHPHVSADDNVVARLSRAGFFAARAQLARSAPDGTRRGMPLWQRLGTFVQAAGEQEAQRWQALAADMRPPAEFVQFLRADEAQSRIGVAPRTGGWWFGQGAIVAAAAWCEALLAHPEVSVRTGVAAQRLELDGGRWTVEDAGGNRIASGTVCVVATALDAARLLQLAHAPVRPVRGEISLLDAPGLASMRAAMGGGGSLVPVGAGRVAIGATYETDASTEPLSQADTLRAHESNLARLARMLPAPVAATPVGLFDATRCVARDRLPLAGAVADEAAVRVQARVLRGAHPADLPRVPGLYASFALGSRGLTLAPLAGEWIATQIEGEPWPLERELAARIDAGRFVLEAVRRGRLGRSEVS